MGLGAVDEGAGLGVDAVDPGGCAVGEGRDVGFGSVDEGGCVGDDAPYAGGDVAEDIGLRFRIGSGLDIVSEDKGWVGGGRTWMAVARARRAMLNFMVVNGVVCHKSIVRNR